MESDFELKFASNEVFWSLFRIFYYKHRKNSARSRVKFPSCRCNSPYKSRQPVRLWRETIKRRTEYGYQSWRRWRPKKRTWKTWEFYCMRRRNSKRKGWKNIAEQSKINLRRQRNPMLSATLMTLARPSIPKRLTTCALSLRWASLFRKFWPRKRSQLQKSAKKKELKSSKTSWELLKKLKIDCDDLIKLHSLERLSIHQAFFSSLFDI